MVTDLSFVCIGLFVTHISSELKLQTLELLEAFVSRFMQHLSVCNHTNLHLNLIFGAYLIRINSICELN